MRLLLMAGFSLLVLLPARAELIRSPAVPLERSLSSSQQFVIYYQDKTIRARLARKVEDIKKQWLQQFSLPDEWKAPIIIRLLTIRPPNAPRITTGIYESDNHELKIQIDIYEPTVVQTADFDIEVYRALCLEYGYRKTLPQAGKAVSQPPAWLLEGLYEEAMSKDQGLPAGLYDSIINQGPPPKLEAFLKERPFFLDATSRAIYRAKSLGLLRALLSTKGGAANLASYLSQLPTIDVTEVQPLMAVFPALASDPSRLPKIWALSIANASATDRFKPLGMEETQNQLAVIMDLTAPGNPKKPEEKPLRGPAAMPAIARSDEGRYVLTQKSEDLLRLEVRAHPMLRPIIEEYRLIASQLAMKPRKNMTDRIAKTSGLLRAMTEKSTQMVDYLNWYEATRLDLPSGQFANAMTDSAMPAYPRTDEISRHLDDLEARGW